ncbi:DUF4345 family protein [Halorubrum halophilum]|uniref:DUF4345 family protein n=1 Tax=Halorubrum halophilum TaxID=413816 RepID=UPI00186B00E0
MLGADTGTKLGGLLGLSGIACTVIGLIAVVSPTSTASQLGYSFASLGGQGEFMTFYGGFYAGIGLFLLAAVRIPSLRPGAAAFLACSATAAIPVRVYSLVQFDITAIVFYELLLGEILFATAGWVGWYWAHQARTVFGAEATGGAT